MSIPVSNIDQAETWSGGGGILGPGAHLCTVAEVDDSQPSPGGHPQIIIQWEADDGLGTKDWIVVVPPNPDGSGGTYGKVRQLYEACGVADALPTGENQVLETGVLLGKKAVVTVALQPNPRGEMKSKVMGYKQPGAGDGPSASSYQNTAAAAPAAGGGAAAPKDDLPF